MRDREQHFDNQDIWVWDEVLETRPSVICWMNSLISWLPLSGFCAEIRREELFLLLPVQILCCPGTRGVLHHIPSLHSLEHWSIFIQKAGHHMGGKCHYYYLPSFTTASSETVTCFVFPSILHIGDYFLNHRELSLLLIYLGKFKSYKCNLLCLEKINVQVISCPWNIPSRVRW